MADDIVGGLFGVNPAMYQQQQQQQVFNRAVALQNLNPFQQAAVGLQQAGYNLGGALGGAMGGVDPQLQRISTLNAISKQIDQSNPESILQGARLLADAGFTQEALGLANYARKANSELALAQQRMKEGRAAAIPKEVQIAEYVSTVKTQLGQLQAMEQTPDVVNAIALLQNRLDALPQPKEGSQNADIVKAQRAAQIVNQLAVLNGLPEGQRNPDAIRALETELAILNPTKEASQNAKIAEAQRAGQITSQLAVLRALPKEQQSEDAIRTLETELAVLNPTKADAQNSQIAQALRVGELTGQVDILQEIPEAQQNKPLIKRLQAELSFLTKGEKVDAGTTEFKNAKAYADSLGLVNGSPEWQKAFADKFAELIATTGKTAPSVGADREAIAKELYGKPFSGLSQAEIKAVNAEADRRDLAAKKAGAAAIKVEVSSAQKQEGSFSTKTGELDAQVLADTRTSAIAAAQALSSIASMKQLDKTGQLVTGPLANSYVGASNLLASIGLLSPNQISILTSSQVYDKSAKDLVMQDLGGKLGAQISDADRKFVEDRIPQLTTSAKARTELLDKIEQIQKGKVEYFRKMKAHANKYRNLDEFDFSEVYTIIPTAGSSAATATKAKADAIIKGTK
jgi:hypothetical protein